ncbi:ornithine carbamoyltransferase [Synchytrium microbalum]|uniref:ornithine carbamoyltransferase n=1 Tax=Synchytrium microbalum TaxID=1806994 RepID=A0A507CCF0_9FUNG|nr:ornithine carbamoyltransferase [Synchytrium microbalum]TPX35245.1 ornithine carbamoyltransferase [Synchytrium microbalum]
MIHIHRLGHTRAIAALKHAISNQTYHQQHRPFPKALLSMQDLSVEQILVLIRRSLELKAAFKTGTYPPSSTSTSSINKKPLDGKTLAMIFAKRSTRTRVSAESGWAYYGGHPMFLSKEDVQLSGGEPLKDTAIVVSSMVDCLLARVAGHEEIEILAKHSTVPVINALSAKFHPLQILADISTLYEAYVPDALAQVANSNNNSQYILPPLPKLKVAWVGDANNILFDLLCALPRLGTSISAACPPGYEVDADVREYALHHASLAGAGNVEFTNSPQVAVKDADVIVTDTWISMGQEAEKEARLKAFKGYQVTEAMASGARPNWKFLHCLPRKKEEVDDEVFYGPRSLVFPEAQFRKFTVMAVYEMLMLWNKQ